MANPGSRLILWPPSFNTSLLYGCEGWLGIKPTAEINAFYMARGFINAATTGRETTLSNWGAVELNITAIDVPPQSQLVSATVAPGENLTITAEADDDVIVARVRAANHVYDALQYQPPATFAKAVKSCATGRFPFTKAHAVLARFCTLGSSMCVSTILPKLW